MLEFSVFVLWWVILIPAFVARISSTLGESELFARPRAWVQHRYSDWTWVNVAYLVGCRECLSHWVAMFPAILLVAGYLPSAQVGPIWVQAILLWGSTTQLANKLWTIK